MATIVSKELTLKYCKEKQVVEAMLAKKIYEHFNKGEARSKLQKLATRCAQNMVYAPEAALDAAAQEEGSLGVWAKIQRKDRQGLIDFFGEPNSKVNTLDISDVSDIIRLYGCWVEKGGSVDNLGGPGQDAWDTIGKDKNFTKASSMKDAYRPGVPVGVPKEWTKAEVENVWGDQKPGRFANVAEARRFRGPGQAIEDHIKPFMRNPDAFSGMGGLPSKPAVGKRAANNSNVLKIDRIFGLVVGADISGTTTDTVFALETLGADLLTATYYMLPLATIVHNNHHALIEVALALSINGVIDYHIGFYSSLLPKSVKTIPPELVGIRGTLGSAEGSNLNRHFAVFYDTNTGAPQIAGCYLFTEHEVKGELKQYFKATKLLEKAPNLDNYPTQNSLKALFDDQIKVA